MMPMPLCPRQSCLAPGPGSIDCHRPSASSPSLASGGCDKLDGQLVFGRFQAVCSFFGSPVVPATRALTTTRSIKRIITDIAVLQQAASPASVTMSASPESSPVNGHTSPVVKPVSVQLLDPEPSDSDLSDAPVPDLGSPASASRDELDPIAANGRPDDFDDPSSSSDEDAPNDGDFEDAVDAASPISNGDRAEPASSDDSRGASKRKAGHSLEEDYIRENPELYGLRRSVRCHGRAF